MSNLSYESLIIDSNSAKIPDSDYQKLM